MKRLLFFIVLFCSPVFAENLPIQWFEAGKETEVPVIGLSGHWELRYEHRILDRGTIADTAEKVTKIKIKIPPLKPGLQMRAKMFINGAANSEALIASPDPFENPGEWFDKHPIALYDPEKTTAEILEREKVPFTHLRSFADIEAVKQGVIIIGEKTDFDRERGLAELLYEYAANGGSVYVAAPEGSLSLHFPKPIDSLLMTKRPKHLFPDMSESFFRAKGHTWTLRASHNQVIIVREFDPSPDADGTEVVDIRFQDTFDPIRGQITGGRIVFDCFSVFRTWEGWIESRWYFKSLIETLSNHQGDQP